MYVINIITITFPLNISLLLSSNFQLLGTIFEINTLCPVGRNVLLPFFFSQPLMPKYLFQQDIFIDLNHS